MTEEEEDFAPLSKCEKRRRTPEESSSKSTSTRDLEETKGPRKPMVVPPRRVSRSAYATKRKVYSSTTAS